MGMGELVQDDLPLLDRGATRPGGPSEFARGASVPADLDSFPPEDLHCPSCNYGVYGLPTDRCPECGQLFTWDEVRVVAERLRSPLFEDRWFDDPVFSLLRCWGWAVFRPRRLWEAYKAAGPPRAGPLIAFLLLQWLLFARGWYLLAEVFDPLMNYLGVQVAEASQRPLRFNYRFRPGGAFLMDLGVWYLATFAAFQAFFESKRRCKVNWRHFLRVLVHASAFASFCTVLWFVVELLVDASLFIRPVRVTMTLYNSIGQVVFWSSLAMTWGYLWYGFRRHLKMPHGWAVAGVSIFIGFLAMHVVRLFI